MSSILHIVTGLGDGGAEAVLYRLCTSDDPARHHVISMMDGGKYGPMLQEAGVRVTCLNMPRGRVDLSGLRHLLRVVRRDKPDVVQTWMYHANLIGTILRLSTRSVPIIWGVHHERLLAADSKLSTRLTNFLCACLSWVVPQAIVSCGFRVAQIHEGNGYAKKFVIIPNGCDLAEFSPKGRELPSHEGEVTPLRRPAIGMVARWVPEKDHVTFLKAIASLRKGPWADLRVVLIGEGCVPENVELAQALSLLELDDKVELLGRRSDVAELMAELDVHVLSSSNEAFGNITVEAMACGTPCVVTDVGDAALIVGDTGWVVPPRDPDALARAIAQAIEAMADAASWQHRQVNARRRIEDNFSLATMIARYNALWQGAVDDAARTR